MNAEEFANRVDIEAIKRRYEAHVDEWIAGKGSLMPPHIFLAEAIADAMVEQLMAEQGIIAA